jgi:hypothetical protein
MVYVVYRCRACGLPLEGASAVGSLVSVKMTQIEVRHSKCALIHLYRYASVFQWQTLVRMDSYDFMRLVQKSPRTASVDLAALDHSLPAAIFGSVHRLTVTGYHSNHDLNKVEVI